LNRVCLTTLKMAASVFLALWFCPPARRRSIRRCSLQRWPLLPLLLPTLRFAFPRMQPQQDRQHGNDVAVWESMGRPETPNPGQTELLRKAAWATNKEVVRADANGTFDLRRTISAWSLVLVKEL